MQRGPKEWRCIVDCSLFGRALRIARPHPSGSQSVFFLKKKTQRGRGANLASRFVDDVVWKANCRRLHHPSASRGRRIPSLGLEDPSCVCVYVCVRAHECANHSDVPAVSNPPAPPPGATSLWSVYVESYFRHANTHGPTSGTRALHTEISVLSLFLCSVVAPKQSRTCIAAICVRWRGREVRKAPTSFVFTFLHTNVSFSSFVYFCKTDGQLSVVYLPMVY